MAFTLDIGQAMVPFELPGTDGKRYAAGDFDSEFLVIFFTCNHCPYVINSEPFTKTLAERVRGRVQFVGINSNSVEVHASDSFADMQARMESEKFPWVYLHDEAQTTALGYGALRTPHFFLFGPKDSGGERRLVYTGRGLDNPRAPEAATINDLERAIDEALAGKPISTPVTNPVGCNVKWKGHDAHWMPPEACDLV